MRNLFIATILFLGLSVHSQSLTASNQEVFLRSESDHTTSKEMISVDKLFFDFDNYILNLEAIKNSKAIISVLKENPKMKIIINSYSNAKETIENISLKRAIETKNFFIKKGIDSKRLSIKNFGNTKQVTEKNSEFLDRRVEFLFN